MSITKSVEFYCGKKNILKNSFFCGKFLDYQFTLDIAYTDVSFSEASEQLRKFMSDNNIKIGYCDISADFGGGYSLFRRYTFINKNGTIVTKKKRYDC